MDLERELRINDEYRYLISSLREARRLYGIIERDSAMEQLNRAFEARVGLLTNSLDVLTEARLRATNYIEDHFKKLEVATPTTKDLKNREINRIYQGIIKQIDAHGYKGNEAFRYYQEKARELIATCNGQAAGILLTMAFNKVIAELRRRDEQDEKT